MLCEPIPYPYGRYIILYSFRVSMFQDSQQRCSPGCYSEQKILIPAGIVFTNTQKFKQIIAFILFLWWSLLSWCPKGWSEIYRISSTIYDDHSLPDVLKDDSESFEILLLTIPQENQIFSKICKPIYIYLFFSPKGFFC